MTTPAQSSPPTKSPRCRPAHHRYAHIIRRPRPSVDTEAARVEFALAAIFDGEHARDLLRCTVCGQVACTGRTYDAATGRLKVVPLRGEVAVRREAETRRLAVRIYGEGGDGG